MADYLEKINGLENYRILTHSSGDEGFLPKATYKDYKRIPDNIHCELINGVFYMMASPDPDHQWISGELFTQLKIQLQNKNCTPFYELDVSTAVRFNIKNPPNMAV